MNKAILEAFAEEIRREREKEIESPAMKRAVQAQVELVIRVASKFNPRFDETKFRKACQSKGKLNT